MPPPVRVALLGNGFAARVQLPALRHVGGNEVLGIAGRDLERARATARRFGLPRATTDYRELLDLDPDLVIVTTPVDLHAPMVQDALETRAAILCEKPFTLDAAEARPLVERAAGRLALIDHELRSTPQRARLQELCEEGFVGAVWHVRAQAAWGQPMHADRPWSWWYDKARGGGVLGAGASHLVDLVRLHLGEILSVRARLETYVAERASDTGPRAVTADEHASLWLRLASGARGTIDADLILPHGSFLRFEIWGEQGYLRLDDEEHLFAARRGETPREVPLDVGEYGAADPELARYGPFGRAEPLYLRAVLDAVAEGRSELPGAATFADGLACMQVLDAARESDASGRWVPCG
jgi:predicted dehydrogenase